MSRFSLRCVWQRPVGALALLVWLAAARATAQIAVVQNDSVIDFGAAVIQAGFAADERGASWLTSPCDGDLIAVRLLWLDFAGSGSQTLGQAVTISSEGTFPAPGPMLAELVGPVMTEGFFNEFVLTPAIPIGQDETFVVDFKFLTSPPPLGPSLVTDADGCQASRNGVFAIPPSSWLDLCGFGVSGDLAIRAVVACGPSTIFADGFESGDTSAWSTTEPFGTSTFRGQYPVLRVDPDLPPFWRYATEE